MKWFKHLSNSRRDIFIQELMAEHGHAGYAVWFMIIEIIAEDSGRELTGIIDINQQLLANELRIKRKRLENILSFCQEHNKFLVTFHEKKVRIEFPKILEIKDNYQKDLQATSKKLAPNLEKTKTKSIEKSKSKSQGIKYGAVDIQIVDFFVDGLRHNFPDMKMPSNLDKWRDSSRLMREQDNRTVDKIKEMIVWSSQSEFWKPNILSMKKLREKFDTLVAQSQRKQDRQPTKVQQLKSNLDAVEEKLKASGHIKTHYQIGER